VVEILALPPANRESTMGHIYQIIEISVDADGNEGARRRSWSFDTLQEAINRINNLLSRCKSGRFEKEKGYWWCKAMNGDRMHFVIEVV
jgi:hypothetical protein